MSSENQVNNTAVPGSLLASLDGEGGLGGRLGEEAAGLTTASTTPMMPYPSAEDVGAGGYMYLPYSGTSFPSADVPWSTGYDQASLLAIQNMLPADLSQQLLASPAPQHNPPLFFPPGAMMTPEVQYLMNNYLYYSGLPTDQTVLASAVGGSADNIINMAALGGVPQGQGLTFGTTQVDSVSAGTAPVSGGSLGSGSNPLVNLSGESLTLGSISNLGSSTGEPITSLDTSFSDLTITSSDSGQATAIEPTPVTMATNIVQQNGSEEPSMSSVQDVVPPPIAVATKEEKKQKTSAAPDKPMSWAAVAKQPPKPAPPKPQLPPPTPVQSAAAHELSAGGKQSRGQEGSSQGHSSGGKQGKGGGGGGGKNSHSSFSYASASSGGKGGKKFTPPVDKDVPAGGLVSSSAGPVSKLVKQLHAKNHFNPKDFFANLGTARFFVVKSYAEDDIHRSLKYNVWTSTENGNRRLDGAFKERKGKGEIYLFFSVNGSGHFCGIAQMVSDVDFHTITGIWAQDKWRGRFSVRWIYVKDVPNGQLRHIRLENNENKPVTNSRDTQEVPHDKGKQVFKIIHSFGATSSIFDDFEHYEEKEREQKELENS